jgi:molybdate transport system ATP-binding protein
LILKICCNLPVFKIILIYTLIKFENVSIRRNGEIVLQNINWEIAPNENWLIVGATGSGKSTLLESILRKHNIVEGSIQYSIYKDQFRKYIAQVPNDYSFNQFLIQNIQYYQQRYNAFDNEVVATVKEILLEIADESTVNEMAKALNISHLLDRHIIKLSTGETRRTLIAVSMLKYPEVLLLDNPFGGLDADSRALLHDALKNIINQGKQVIMTVNEVSDEFGYFDKVKPLPTLPDREGFTINQSKTDLTTSKIFFEGKPLITVNKGKALPIGEGWEGLIAVRFKNVTIRYGENIILENVNWTVKRGEKWALLGPNGSGKSTLLSLMYADNPQAYAFNITLFDKRRGTGETIWDIKKRMGFLSSEFHLHYKEHLPCFEVIATGIFDTVGLHKILNEEQLQRIDYFLQLFDIQHIKHKFFRQVSFGEQRLVLLARAMIKNPEFLILDEPTQNLDLAQREKVKAILDDIYHESGTTIIYVTHTIEDIPKCIDKIKYL